MGSIMNLKRDLTHQRFGRLLVIYPTDKRIGKHVVWCCLCDCGNLTEVMSCHLISGNTKSCGCFKKERQIGSRRAFKHGDAIKIKNVRYYRTWLGINSRCSNPNATGYKYYGGRDIKVCDEWKNSYEAFRDWALLNGYADNLIIDRINSDGNYTPENCRWITQPENLKKSHKEKKWRKTLVDISKQLP